MMMRPYQPLPFEPIDTTLHLYPRLLSTPRFLRRPQLDLDSGSQPGLDSRVKGTRKSSKKMLTRKVKRLLSMLRKKKI